MPCNTAGCLATSGRPPPPDERVAGSYSPAARSASPSLRAAVLLPSDSECSPRSERCPTTQRLGVLPSLRALSYQPTARSTPLTPSRCPTSTRGTHISSSLRWISRRGGALDPAAQLAEPRVPSADDRAGAHGGLSYPLTSTPF